jgi:hypothetical protein
MEQAGDPLGAGPWHKQAKEQKLVCGGKVFARLVAVKQQNHFAVKR